MRKTVWEMVADLGRRACPALALLLAVVLLPLTPVLASEATDAYTLAFDNSKWEYEATDDVYWQVGVVCCATPETTDYESLGIYVPGAYLYATDNGDGTYTCYVNEDAELNGFTAATAPMVMPVNTPGYSAQAAPTGYTQGIADYTGAGLIYVSAGCRGRVSGYDEEGNLLYNGGAPWGVTDLKAAVRYLRYNDAALPGNIDGIFTFGMSGGGAQSALMGATGDSALYTPYLESIGAAMTDAQGNALSDAVAGAMCWCPITSLDYANEAYEWNMGQYSQENTRASGTWTDLFSDDLSVAFADYINELQITDGMGNVLTLEESEARLYAAGSYYDTLLAEIEHSLNNFLSDTAFPYTSGGGFSGMPAGDMGGELPGGGIPGGGGPSEGGNGTPGGGGMPEDMGDLPEGEGGPPAMGGGEAVTYDTVEDYIAALNEDEIWVTYDAESNTANITSIEAFVVHCKTPSKNVGAFDDLNRSQAENYVFGTAGHDALHFDAVMAGLLDERKDIYAGGSGWDERFVADYQDDLAYTDALGTDTETRQHMYNPMYYLWPAYEGNGTSTVARHWRIHSGIEQSDTALTVEFNLALALRHCEDVEDVEFEMVWGQGHTQAERTGDATTNFIEWVVECSQ